MNGAPLAARVGALFTELRHAGDCTVDAAGEGGKLRCGEAGHERLGTRVRFCLCLADNRVLQVRYRAYGCPYTLATCEWLARRLQGAQLPGCSAQGLGRLLGGPADWAEAVGVPQGRLGRLLVIEDALHAAVGAGQATGEILTQP